MALPLDRLVKGQLTQTLFCSLLERGGYRITRLGLEELLYELRLLSREQYLTLGLPENLRSLPDFLFSTKDLTQAWLVEVTFRKVFIDVTINELIGKLVYQRQSWPTSLAVVMLGSPEIDAMRFHQDYMRVIPSGELDLLRVDEDTKQRVEAEGVQSVSSLIWNRLPTLLRIFPGLQEQGISRGMDETTRILKSLSALEQIRTVAQQSVLDDL